MTWRTVRDVALLAATVGAVALIVATVAHFN